MPRTGGVYTLPNGYQAVTGEIIQPSQHNPPLEDIAQALTDSLPRNGAAAMTGNLPMGNNRITGLAPATSPNHAARWDQVMPATGGTVTGIITVQRSGVDMLRFINSDYSTTDFGVIRINPDGELEVSSAISGSTPYRFASSNTTPDNPWQVITYGTGNSLYVPLARTVSTGSGLTGGGNLSANRTLAVDGTVVRTSRQVATGSGLTGGGDLSANRSLSLSLGNIPFNATPALDNPIVVALNGGDSGTQVRIGPAGLRDNFGLAGSATTITAGAGLTGGGNLSANRTLAIDIATPAQAQAGSNNTTVITPLRLAQATIGSSVQSWSNVTGSRSAGTVYTNNTGRPIEIRVHAGAEPNRELQVSPNGTSGWVRIGFFVGDSSQVQGGVVPNGHSYRVEFGANIAYWAELR